jgi:hypothetical protein
MKNTQKKSRIEIKDLPGEVTLSSNELTVEALRLTVGGLRPATCEPATSTFCDDTDFNRD